MATAPAFAATPGAGVTAITATANTGRDGTGTVTAIVAGHANGGTVSRLTISATGTTTAGQVRIFCKIGAVYAMIKEIAVSAITPSATVQAFRDQIVFDPPLILAANESIVASTEKAEAFVCKAEWGNF